MGSSPWLDVCVCVSGGGVGGREGEIERRGVGARVIGAAGPWTKWTVGKQAGLAVGLSSLSHSKERKKQRKESIAW